MAKSRVGIRSGMRVMAVGGRRTCEDGVQREYTKNVVYIQGGADSREGPEGDDVQLHYLGFTKVCGLRHQSGVVSNSVV
jgi:hypothetical protein